MDTTALTSAWEKVFESMAVDDLDAYLAEGWMTAELVAQQTGATNDAAFGRLKRMLKSGKIVRKKIRVMHAGIAREVCIYRPQS